MCNLDSFYAKLYTTIGLLLGAAAIGAASVVFEWFDFFSLSVALALVIQATFLFSLLEKELEDYEQCRGQSSQCKMSTTINLLGTAASFISIGTFAAAAALQISALAFIWNPFLIWLGVTMLGASIALATTGAIGCGAAAAILVGLLTNVQAYVDCKDREDRATNPPTLPTLPIKPRPPLGVS